jgi:hypothetical protein
MEERFASSPSVPPRFPFRRRGRAVDVVRSDVGSVGYTSFDSANLKDLVDAGDKSLNRA